MNDETLFHEARRRPPAEREMLLRDVCGTDVARRQRVEALLAADEHPAGFLIEPCLPPENATAAADAGRTASDPGEFSFLGPATRTGSLGRLAHYEVLEVVGHGGMGVVLKAFDEKLHRVVAIKAMSQPLAASPVARRRFIREAQACAAVRDEHVIGIHEVEEANQPPYLVMDYISGQSLRQRIEIGPPLTIAEILRIGMQTASGLAAAHAQGLIHRDVTPSNILLENGVQRVKITDFGLARLVDDASITQPGVVAGTPQYMSPEQAKGEVVDHRSDLFSLGSVLYAMCTGQPPFRGSTTVAVLRRVVDESPRPIREVNAEIPDWLVAVIGKLLDKQPADRFQSAGEVAELLGKQLARLQQPAAEPFWPTAGNEPEAQARESRPLAKRTVSLACASGLSMAALLALSEVFGITHLAAIVFRAPARQQDSVVTTGNSNGKTTSSSSAAANGNAGAIPAAAPPADDPSRPFVILTRDGQPGRTCSTLADAVLNSSEGGTIEIRGNGPLETAPLRLKSRCVIRAGQGFRPVIKVVVPESSGAGLPRSLETPAPLVLEGLEFQVAGPDPQRALVAVNAIGPGSIHIANCRFSGCQLIAQHLSVCQVRNCLVLDGVISLLDAKPSLQAVIDNNIAVRSGGAPFNIVPGQPEQRLALSRNVLIGRSAIGFNVPRRSADDPLTFQIQASQNILVGRQGALHFNLSGPDLAAQAPTGMQAEDVLRKVIAWNEDRNVYSAGVPYLSLGHGPSLTAIEPTRSYQTLADWNQFWSAKDSTSIAGTVRLAGGDVFARNTASSSQLTPADFRLHAESAGYRAGEGGQDLGPNIELVGPSEAYERWKQSAEYQEWRNRTGQSGAPAASDNSPMPAPQLISPLAGARVPNGTRDGASMYFWEFNWGTVPGADRYELEVFAPAGGVSTRVVVASTTYQKVQPAGYSRADADWQWHVRAGRGGQWGPWSEERRFRPAEPSLYAANSPADFVKREGDLRAALQLQANDHASRRALADVLRKQLKFDDAEAEYREAIRLAPGDPTGHEQLAGLFAQSGKWQAAEAALAQAAKLALDNHMTWYRLAVLRLHLGDRKGYESACQEMLKRFEKAEQSEIRERVVRSSLLTADGAGQLAAVTALDKPLVEDEKSPFHWYFMATRALAEFRSGRHGEAISWAEKMAVPKVADQRRAAYAMHDALALTILALAENSAGRSSEARETFASAEQLAKKYFPDPAAGRPFGPENWHDWLICGLLMREAEQALRTSDTGKNASDP
jgi:serine/threonine protein kinase/tetratricopeptide (TPR) repeat protein